MYDSANWHFIRGDVSGIFNLNTYESISRLVPCRTDPRKILLNGKALSSHAVELAYLLSFLFREIPYTAVHERQNFPNK